MWLINRKIELKLRWMKHLVLTVLGNENNNDNADSKNIIFTIKDTKRYVLVVTLSANDNQKLSKLLSKWFERSVYWNGYKSKSENENTTNEDIIQWVYHVIKHTCSRRDKIIVLWILNKQA